MNLNANNLSKFNAKLKGIKKNLIDEGIKIPKKINDVLIEGGTNIRNTMLISMQQTPVSSVRQRRGSKREGNIRLVRPSLPGHPPAVDLGELKRSLLFDVKNMRMKVGVSGGAPYAEDLEKGKGNMKARPFLRPAVEEHEKEIINELAKIIPNAVERSFE